MKKDLKAWAIKLRGRSFYQTADGMPIMYFSKSEASLIAMRVRAIGGTKAEPIRVRVRIEEIQ